MSHAVSDGNGAIYIKRTMVEKALYTLVIVIGGLFLSLLTFLTSALYGEVRSLHDGQIRSEMRMENIAIQSAANGKAIADHIEWASGQKAAIDKKIEDEIRERIANQKGRDR